MLSLPWRHTGPAPDDTLSYLCASLHNYNAKLRYPGIQHILLDIKRTALQQLPCHTYAYLPREGNVLADYLAGEGAERLPPSDGEAVTVNPPLPADLRRRLQIYQAVEERSVTLTEKPNIDIPTLASYWHTQPSHRAEICKYLASLSEVVPACHKEVTYWRTSVDTRGRYYAQGPAAQKLPRQLRLLLFGRNHLEVDIAGAFYEIVRRIDLRGGGATEDRLPHIAHMRNMLERELSTQQPCSHVMPIIKKALHIAMNAPVSTALQYITMQGLQPTHALARALHSVRQITQRVCQALYSDSTTRREHSLPHNRKFFHLEAIEADYMSIIPVLAFRASYHSNTTSKISSIIN